MTIEQAIDRLNKMYGDYRTKEEKEALKMAIDALELKKWMMVLLAVRIGAALAYLDKIK